jgi:hypothetical protein
MTEFMPEEDWQYADELNIIITTEKVIQNKLLIIRGIAVWYRRISLVKLIFLIIKNIPLPRNHTESERCTLAKHTPVEYRTTIREMYQ